VDDVIALHAEILGCSEAEAADQLRSRDGLEGAVARPLWHTYYASADLAMQAAVLAHGIAERQFFVDANKRTALAAMLIFLRLNGRDVAPTQQERADWILRFSEGGAPEEVAEGLRPSLVPISA
jgi:death-on-curing protein